MSRPKPHRQALSPIEPVLVRMPRKRLRRFRPSGRRRTFAVGVPIAILVVVIVSGLGGFAPPSAAAPDTTPRPAAVAPPAGSTTPEPQGRLPSPVGTSPSDPPVSGGSAGAQLPPAGGVAEPEGLTGYVWPIKDGRITGFFAKRKDGFLVVDGRRIHEGLDVTTFCGDHVRAAHDGVVLAAGRRAFTHQAFSGPLAPYYDGVKRRGTLLNLSVSVVIDDGNGYRSVYAHLWDTTVRPGDAVEAGDMIGYEGATGFATGCHLHYELIRMDGPWMIVAPEYVGRYQLPAFTRERIDPMRVLSLDRPSAPTYYWGVRPPKRSPGLGRPTAPAVLPEPLPWEEAPEPPSPGGG